MSAARAFGAWRLRGTVGLGLALALRASSAVAAAAAAPVPLDPQATAFVGVHVVPMDRDTVLRDHTVVVRDGRIVTIGARPRSRPQRGAADRWHGRYLMPGLCDMHVHLRYLKEATTTR